MQRNGETLLKCSLMQEVDLWEDVSERDPLFCQLNGYPAISPSLASQMPVFKLFTTTAGLWLLIYSKIIIIY